jgi:hypothetical protein
MGLIYLLEELFGKVVFVIGEYQFEGIRPLKYIEFPWKNNNEMKEYIKGLEEENTPYSYKKFLYWEEQRHYQKMHILISRSYLYLGLGLIMLVLSTIIIFINNGSPSLTIIGGSIFMFLLSIFLRVRLKKYWTSVVFQQVFYSRFETWPE